MQLEEQLENACKSIGYISDTGKIAIRTLAITLLANERILNILEGACERTIGVLVATELRLLFVGCSPLKNSVIKKINYNQIASIDIKESIIPSNEIEIQLTVERIVIAGCDTIKTKQFLELIQSIIEEKQNRMKDIDDLNM